MAKYKCYEEGFEGTYTSAEMIALYNEIIDKSEYQDFDCWLFDMLKMGLFIEA